MFTWWTSLWLAVWQPLVKPLHHRLISSAVWLSSPLLIKTCLNLNLMLLYSMVPLYIYIHVQCTHVDTIFYPIFLWVYDVIGKFSRLSSSFCHLMIGYPWPHPWTFPRLRCPGLGCGSTLGSHGFFVSVSQVQHPKVEQSTVKLPHWHDELHPSTGLKKGCFWKRP